MKRPSRHRFRLSARAGSGERCLFFGCTCGVSVLQAPDASTFPNAFLNAVNTHLRQAMLDDGGLGQPHLKLAAENANGR